MTGKQRAGVTITLLSLWALLTAQAIAFVNAERIQAGEIKADFLESKVVKGTEEVSSPRVVTQEMNVETKLTAAAIEAPTATVPKLNVPEALTAKTINAQQLNVPALITQSVGDARNLVQAAFIGNLRANSISTDSITLTAGGNPVGTWSAGGLTLSAPITINGGGGSFTLDANAGVLSMKNPGGAELAKLSMAGPQTVLELHTPNAEDPNSKAILTVKQGEQPTLILGNNLYPPLVPWGVEPVEGSYNEEYKIRYWIYAEFDFKTTTYWRMKYRITFENEADTGYRLGLKMAFFDFKGLAYDETYPIPGVNLRKGEKVVISDDLDVNPRLAELTRKIDLVFDTVEPQRFQ